MKRFFVDKNGRYNGYHEVHTQECIYLPDSENRIALGVAPSCHKIMDKALEHFTRVNGCIKCCQGCYHNPFEEIMSFPPDNL